MEKKLTREGIIEVLKKYQQLMRVNKAGESRMGIDSRDFESVTSELESLQEDKDVNQTVAYNIGTQWQEDKDKSVEQIIKDAGKFPYDKLHDVYTTKKQEDKPRMSAEEIIENIIEKNKQHDFPKYVFEEDYAGGSRKYIREDLVFQAMHEFAQGKDVTDKEIIEAARNEYDIDEEAKIRAYIIGAKAMRAGKITHK